MDWFDNGDGARSRSWSAGVLSECHLWGVTDLMPGPGAGEWAPSPETRRRSVSWCDGRGLEETERLILASPPPGPGTPWRPQISALRKTDVSGNTFLFSPTTLWFSLSPCDSIFHPRTLLNPNITENVMSGQQKWLLVLDERYGEITFYCVVQQKWENEQSWGEWRRQISPSQICRVRDSSLQRW